MKITKEYIETSDTTIDIKYNGKDIDEINAVYEKVDNKILDTIFIKWYEIFKTETLTGEELINHKLVEEFDAVLIEPAIGYIKSLKIDVIPKTRIPKHIYGKEAFELYLYMFRVRLLRPFVSLLTSVFGIGHVKFVPNTIKGPEAQIKVMISEGSQTYNTVCPDFEFNKLMAKGGKPLTNHPLSYIFTSLYKTQRKTFIVPSDEESTTDNGIVDVGPTSTLPVGRLEELKYACSLERLMEFYEIKEDELPSDEEMDKLRGLMDSRVGLLMPDITEMFVELLLKEYLTSIEYDRETVFTCIIILMSIATKYNIKCKNFILPIITSTGTGPLIGPVKVDCFIPLQQKVHQYVRNNTVSEVADVFGCTTKINTLEQIITMINKIIEIAKYK